MSAYVSTLPKRTRPVEAADFAAVPDLILNPVFSDNDVNFIYIPSWNQHIPLLPQDLHRFYKEFFKSDLHLEVCFSSFFPSDAKKEAVILQITNPPHNSFKGVLAFPKTLQETPQTSAVVDESYQAKGIGKAWFASFVELSLALGHERAEFVAGSANGGYTWAKAGAYMDMDPCRAKIREYLSTKLIGRLEAIKDFLPADTFYKARALSRLVAKDDINRLAAMDCEIADRSYAAIKSERGEIFDKLDGFYKIHAPNEVPEAKALAERSVMAQAFNAAERQGRQFTLARCMLSGTNWDAYVDFNDAGQMERVGAYVGGWKTIVPNCSRSYLPSSYTHSQAVRPVVC